MKIRRRPTVLAAVTIGLGLVLAVGGASHESDVASTIKSAESCRFEMRTVFPMSGRIVEGTVRWRAKPRVYRFDHRRNDRITDVEILRADRPGISMNLEEKNYRITSARRDTELPPALMLRLAQFFERPQYTLGRNVIFSKQADGIEVPLRDFAPDMGDGKARMWVDADSRWPLLVEYLSDDPQLGVKRLQNFQWNAELADTFFDCVAPKDYANITPEPPTLKKQAEAIVTASTFINKLAMVATLRTKRSAATWSSIDSRRNSVSRQACHRATKRTPTTFDRRLASRI